MPLTAARMRANRKGQAMLTYCYTLTPDDNDTLLVQFPDLPEAAAVGEDADSAKANAVEGLEAALQMYLDARRPVPLPAAVGAGAVGAGAVTLPAVQTAKVLLSNEMVVQGIRKAELARRLNLHMPQVDRMLDLSHASKIEAIESAFAVLGKRLNIEVAQQ
ncbi:type II toxin-antitoxin system HicB family antitoxin [Alcaligenaceae bacterium C4P045]|nr:type II toxin-antitoxin system HicB family antitoxin [Alcaligenaceae bacterium C4P045]